MTDVEAVAIMVSGIVDGAAGVWVNSRRSRWFEVAMVGQRIGWLAGMELDHPDEQSSIGKFRYTDKAKEMVLVD